MDSRGATRLSVIGLGKLGAPMAAVFAAKGFTALQELRRNGLSAEIIASGSPRKRFDKASKLNPRGILSLGGTGTLSVPIRSSDEVLVNRVAELLFEKLFKE